MSRKSITLSQACEGMIRYKQATGKSENTIADYRVTFKKLFYYFESDPQIGAITRSEMIEFFAWLQEDYLSEPSKLFWRGLDQNLDVMPDALRRQVGQIPNLLSEKDPRQAKVVKYCAGINHRVLVVDVRKVQEFYGVTLSAAE
ncbi:MAG: hypothetical protein MUO77_02590 [Anaerolineales bacterium]|nr:hypothetical protein [Anaerolineales bacterium]